MSIGDTLAEARRQSGLTIAQVSQRTRIRESIIRAIEQNDFSSCGGDFYARGHIRSVADVVGSDPASLIMEYDTEHPPASMSAADVFEPSTPIKIREPRRRLPAGVLAVVALLGIIGYFSYLLADSGGGHPTAAPAATARPVATPKAVASPVPSPSPTPAYTEAVIVLTAARDCWVNLTTPAGKQIYQGVVAAGKTMTWKEKHKVSLVIGNPVGVSLWVDGKRVKANTVQVVTLSISPTGQNPVSVAAPAGTKLTTS